MVKIKLTDEGEVISVQIVTSSGHELFDRAAVLAVKKSSPLPMPTEKHIVKQFKEFLLRYEPQTLML